MENKTEGTKQCKYCKKEIAADAKICPYCRKKQGGKKKWMIIGIIIVVFIIIGIASGGKDESSSNSAKPTTSTSQKAEQQREYTAVDVDSMMDDLKNNALGASEKYKGKYFEVTGKLAVIDSDGAYISLHPMNSPFSITGVQCYIKNKDQKSIVAKLHKDDTVTVRGKIIDVGEVMGYTLDIVSFVQQ